MAETANLGITVPETTNDWGGELNDAFEAIDDLWDSETPVAFAFGDAADEGDSLNVARADHVHEFPDIPWPDANLLINPSFNIHFANASLVEFFPGWLSVIDEYPGSNFYQFHETTTVDDSVQSCKLQLPGSFTGTHRIGQYIEIIQDGTTPYSLTNAGQTLSGRVRIKTANASSVRAYFQLSDGTIEYSDYHTGDNTWQSLDVSITVPFEVDADDEDRIYIVFGVVVSPSTVGLTYIDNACVVVGPDSRDYIPRLPAIDRFISDSVATFRSIFITMVGLSDGTNYKLAKTEACRNPRSSLGDAEFVSYLTGVVVHEEGAAVDTAVSYSYVWITGDGGSYQTNAVSSFGISISKAAGGSKPSHIEGIVGNLDRRYVGSTDLAL